MNHGLPPAVVLLLSLAALGALYGVSLLARRAHPWLARFWQEIQHTPAPKAPAGPAPQPRETVPFAPSAVKVGTDGPAGEDGAP